MNLLRCFIVWVIMAAWLTCYNIFAMEIEPAVSRVPSLKHLTLDFVADNLPDESYKKLPIDLKIEVLTYKHPTEKTVDSTLVIAKIVNNKNKKQECYNVIANQLNRGIHTKALAQEKWHEKLLDYGLETYKKTYNTMLKCDIEKNTTIDDETKKIVLEQKYDYKARRRMFCLGCMVCSVVTIFLGGMLGGSIAAAST